jgi:hypothetical protein
MYQACNGLQRAKQLLDNAIDDVCRIGEQLREDSERLERAVWARGSDPNDREAKR